VNVSCAGDIALRIVSLVIKLEMSAVVPDGRNLGALSALYVVLLFAVPVLNTFRLARRGSVGGSSQGVEAPRGELERRGCCNCGSSASASARFGGTAK
jgi:hypothetical protein